MVTGFSPFELMFGREAADERDSRMATIVRAELVGVKSGDRTVASIKAGQLVLKKPNAIEKTKMGKGSVKYLGPYVVMKIAGDALHIKDLVTNMSEKVKSHS